MKAILKSNRKVIVDVVESDLPMPNDEKVYEDTKTGAIFCEHELDWVEYYGG